MPSRTGHADVHQHHVGPMPADHGDGRLAIDRFGNDRDVAGLAEQVAQPGSDHALVVGDDDPDGHRDTRGRRGKVAWMEKPRSERGPVSRVPP